MIPKIVVYFFGRGRPPHSDASGHIYHKPGVATPLYPIKLLKKAFGKDSYIKRTATLGEPKGPK